MFLAASAVEQSTPGLLAALPQADISLLAAGAIVFGAQRLIPSYKENYADWYPKLIKPKWNPPNYVFPLVWIPLKALQSVALWLVWKTGTAPGADPINLVAPLTVFGIHIFLGNFWNVVFFGRRQLKPSLKWMAAFWLSVAGSIGAFGAVHRDAGLLIAPTLIWVTIAAKLNYDIVRLNTDAGKSP